MRVILFIFCLGIVFGSPLVQAQPDMQERIDSQDTLNFSTPEATWQQFKNAMIAGDLDLALACCCPGSNRLLNRYKKFGKVKASRAFRSVKSIEKVHQDDASTQFRVNRDINGTQFTTYISFAKIDDQWKINKY